MDKKLRNILLIIILLLLISNIILLLTFYFKPNTCTKCSAEIHPKKGQKHRIELLDLSDSQKAKMKVIWKEMRKEGEPISLEINSLHKDLIAEISAESPDNEKIDSLENEVINRYKVLLQQTGMEYNRVAEILDEKQIKTLNCIYFDLFLRIYSLPQPHNHE